ncbi:MAG: ribbon-helix-helix domain-containing protein [Oceanicaulis sp.]|uniref:ribbon-helix-helix domain-containing protein n=1 Tax=Glycocaulis sp. TaxID=1969725 RepID=UPI00345B7F79|nr:ribbon-helix-helix domain-containing protein [Oceanicaulis sp.]
MSMLKRSLSLAGHRTSLALEAEFWAVMDAAAEAEGRSLASLVAEIDEARAVRADQHGLASACRIWALQYVQARA